MNFTVLLTLWNDLYCIKHYRNKLDSIWNKHKYCMKFMIEFDLQEHEISSLLFSSLSRWITCGPYRGHQRRTRLVKTSWHVWRTGLMWSGSTHVSWPTGATSGKLSARLVSVKNTPSAMLNYRYCVKWWVAPPTVKSHWSKILRHIIFSEALHYRNLFSFWIKKWKK